MSTRCTDVSDCIDGLATVPVTVARQQPGTYVKGRYVEPNPTEFFPVVSVQPVTGKEQLLLPEGVRTRQTVKIYSKMRLMTSSQSTSQRADIVNYKNQNYEVFTVEDWTDVGGFYKAICVLQGQG
jgi:hypothetical protein